MPLNGQEVICREFHFDRGGSTSEFTTATNATGAVSYVANTTRGVQLSVGASADRAYLHFNGRLLFDIDDILKMEALYLVQDWDDNTDGLIGLCSAFNADPDAITESAWFRISGGVTGRNLAVQTDDGTRDISESTGVVVPNLTWMRSTLDFASGIQTIAPPGKSKGGKASIMATTSDENGFVQPIKTSVHLDMSAYSAGLQPIFGLRQTGAMPGPAYLFVKSFKVWVRQAA